MASTDFASLGLSEGLVRTVRELGYERMTPVQAEAIPLLLAGRDLVGQSRTGSGKTAAFALPILERLGPDRAVQALILCPTRELCAQVAREIRKLGRHLPGLRVLTLSGGQPIGPQLAGLEQGAHLVVGTPGRVIDHLTRRSLDLRGVETLVLDEADRMLEMGFEEDMERVFEELPAERQTILFSATFPRSIESLSRGIQHEPVRVTITREAGEASDEGEGHSDIEEMFYEARADRKLGLLISTLERLQPASAIIFCNLKRVVAEVAEELKRRGFSATALSGDLEQRDRDRVLAQFRNQSVRLLVATDVAARGLDIEDLDLVVCFDLPSDPEIYTHRVGRTGRAGRQGRAISFALPGQAAKFGHHVSAIPEAVHEPVAPTATSVLEARMETLRIGAGRKDKMRPGDILGALTGEAGGLAGADVGKIEIHDRFSYVAVSRDVAELALERLATGRIKGRKVRVDRERS